MTHRYDDIIHTSWPQNTGRARMSPGDRAAQFAPFSALTGYDAVIQESARLTESPVFLTEDSLEELNRELNRIARNQKSQPLVRLTVFQDDARKEGGAIVELEGNVKKVDTYEGGIIFTDGREVPFFRMLRAETVE